VARLAADVWLSHDRLRSVQSVVEAGIWQGMFDRLAQSDKLEVQSIDSTTSKAHRCSAIGKGGAESQAIGRSRGGRTTKIHAIADTLGRLIAFEITPGQKGDVRVAAGLPQPLPVASRLLGDTAYNADHLRAFLTERYPICATRSDFISIACQYAVFASFGSPSNPNTPIPVNKNVRGFIARSVPNDMAAFSALLSRRRRRPRIIIRASS
jgi:Transposase DDE domain